MRVIIITDAKFASRERAMLARLEVGLADEGLHVVQALPADLTVQDESLFRRVVRFEQVGLPLSLGFRVARVAEQLERLDEPTHAGPTVVHAFGGASWRFAAELARQLDAGLVIEVWRAGLLQPALRFRPRLPEPPTCLCPDAALAERLATLGAPRVRRAPWGVFNSPRTDAVLTRDRAWSLMFAGSGHDARGYGAAFDAVVRLAARFADLLIFADALAAERSGLWGMASRAGLRERLSLVDEMDANRELVLRGDVLILPEARGEQRTLVLDAMASGVPVVALADPLNTSLVDTVTASLVRAPVADAWHTAIDALLADPLATRALAARAGEFVRTNHRTSQHVAGVIAAYEQVVGRKAERLPASS